MNGECTRVLDLLPLFIGADLADRQMVMVRSHLVDCARCRREAAGLQQSVKALVGLAIDAPRVDDDAFAGMHTDIMAAVAREATRVEQVAGRVATIRTCLIAAAVLLVAIGWWAGSGRSPERRFQRPAMAMPISDGQPWKVVPYAGAPADMRWLGDEEPGVGDGQGDVLGDGLGHGLLGRDRLRPLVENLLDLPPGPPAKR